MDLTYGDFLRGSGSSLRQLLFYVIDYNTNYNTYTYLLPIFLCSYGNRVRGRLNFRQISGKFIPFILHFPTSSIRSSKLYHPNSTDFFLNVLNASQSSFSMELLLLLLSLSTFVSLT